MIELTAPYETTTEKQYTFKNDLNKELKQVERFQAKVTVEQVAVRIHSSMSI